MIAPEIKKDSISLVTLGVIARNEEDALPDLLSDIMKQSFPHDKIEIILVDGMSSDATWDIMHKFLRSNNNDFYDILVCRNENKTQPCGWNIVIGAARGDAIIRVDAHARIPENFVKASISLLDEGEDVCGGVRPTIIKNPTGWQEVLHMAEESAFGSSAAPYRRDSARRYVKSVFHGCYRRGVFDKSGLFDERLSRTEDNELHYRIRKNGFRICLSPTIYSEQLARASFGKMLKQKYLNGYWIGKTLYIEPHCFQLYHFIPLLFVLILLSLILIGALSTWVPLFVFLLIYLSADLALSIIAIRTSWPVDIRAVLLPLIFLCIHLSYGIGTLFGILAGPFWRAVVDNTTKSE